MRRAELFAGASVPALHFQAPSLRDPECATAAIMHVGNQVCPAIVLHEAALAAVVNKVSRRRPS